MHLTGRRGDEELYLLKNVGLLSANFPSDRLGLPNCGLPCLWTLRICIWCHSRTLASYTTFDLIFPCGKKMRG